MQPMDTTEAIAALERDLKEVFVSRLQSLSAYGQRDSAVHTLAVVASLTTTDLRACADRAARWHDRGLATPLVLVADEFSRSIDVFPLEFGAILADHQV